MVDIHDLKMIFMKGNQNIINFLSGYFFIKEFKITLSSKLLKDPFCFHWSFLSLHLFFHFVWRYFCDFGIIHVFNELTLRNVKINDFLVFWLSVILSDNFGIKQFIEVNIIFFFHLIWPRHWFFSFKLAIPFIALLKLFFLILIPALFKHSFVVF